ncbi:MAG: hypothetical protein P4L33_15395 [Capsulimonadaceae bacterium]|nr:hypothetical protein [Capsulimonadaceae bacterium]
MPLASTADVVPQLTTVAKPDGFQYELMLSAATTEKAVTRIRLGPYHFDAGHRPKVALGGLVSMGGPESSLLMHRASPARWSRPRWVEAVDEADHPVYLEWNGYLAPGTVGVIRFLSIYPPGGLRTGLSITRGNETTCYGVTGPNYEHLESGHETS